MVLLFINRSNSFHINIANFGIFAKKLDYKECYKILRIEEISDNEQIRSAYLNLVKRFHPDSGTDEANAEKFQEIDKAFKMLMRKKSKERYDVEEGVIVDHPDIKHTAPQHRQYLNYEGVGSGTPSQRQKQYTNIRATQAVENVLKHRIDKAMINEKALLDKKRIYETWEKVPFDHKIKTKHGIDRLVEDLIQESISKGEFNNLKGKGKPLPIHNNNPYVDFTTHKINEVLIDNGFAPEWISLQKEIKEETKRLRKDLLVERKYFGPYPLTVDDNIKWSERVYKYKNIVENINKKITKFNLLVPVLNNQMLHVSLENEAQKAVVNGKSSEEVLRLNKDLNKGKIINDSSKGVIVDIFKLIDYIWKRK